LIRLEQIWLERNLGKIKAKNLGKVIKF